MSTLETLVNTAPDEHQYITFRLCGHLFALPSQDVLKIIKTPPPEQGGMVDMGLVQLAQYSIQLLELSTLLKLEQKVDKEQAAEKTLTQMSVPVDSPTFLMILQAEQELWGIVVARSPDLRTISDSELKPVRASKRLSGALQGISHVVTYPQSPDARSPKNKTEYETHHDSISERENRQILLVLDLCKLLALSKAQTPPASVGAASLEQNRPAKSRKSNLKSAAIV